MPLEGNGGGGKPAQYCFEWGGQYWGKDYPGWSDFAAWLTSHGDDINAWIDGHPDAAKCIGAVKLEYCFEWGGERWGKSYPGWDQFSAYLLDKGTDPATWAAGHPDAAKCIGAPAPPAKKPPPHHKPPPPPGGKPPPPPPETKPPVGSPWTSPPWWGRGMHVTWGFPKGDFTPAGLADKLAASGYQWAALEGYPADSGPLDNSPYHAAFRDALHAHGLRYGIWERTDQVGFDHVKGMLDAYSPDFYLADVEINWTRPENTTLPAAFAEQYPSLPRAVLIAGMPDAIYCKPWIDAGFDCMTQSYTGPNALQTAGSMDSGARNRGWPLNAAGHYSWPVLEIHAEGSRSLRDQLGDVAQFGGNYSIYSAEQMTDEDWGVASTATAPPSGGSGGTGGSPPPTGGTGGGGQTDAEGLRFCFEWGDRKWGGDYPGWEPFKDWLDARGVDSDAWILAHQEAAACLDIPEQTDAGGQTQGVTFQLYNPFERGAEFERHDQGIDMRGPPNGYVLAVSDGHVYAVHPNPTAGPGFGESLYYHLDQFGEGFYVGHADAIVNQGDHVVAGQRIAKLRQRPHGNAPTDPWHTEVGFAYGTSPLYPLGDGPAGGDEFQRWLDRYLIPNPGDHSPRTTRPPKANPKVPPPSGGLPPAHVGKFKEPPATVEAWTKLKQVFTKKVPAKRAATRAALDHPKELFR